MALEMLGAPFQEKGLDAEGRVFCSPRPPKLSDFACSRRYFKHLATRAARLVSGSRCVQEGRGNLALAKRRGKFGGLGEQNTLPSASRPFSHSPDALPL
jgi:hypothetical protein